jgi:hypothetical protein
MKQFILKLFLFLLLLAIPLYGLEKYYDSYFSKNLDSCNKPLWVLKQQNNRYDFAVLGSSRVFNMLDILSLEKGTNKNGINIGASGSAYAENYLLLKQFVKTNQIKTLVVQVDLYSLDSKNAFGYPFHDYLYLNKLKESEVDSIYRDNVSPIKYYMWNYIPFSKYMEFSNFFSLYKVIRGGYECESSFLDTTKGSFLVDGNEAFTDDAKADQNNSFKNRYINEKDYSYLKKIVAFARQKNIQVIFYTAPEYYEGFALQGNRNSIFKKISNFAKENSIPYYNFDVFTYGLCKNKAAFKDNTHLNTLGSLKFSSDFADSLRKHL